MNKYIAGGNQRIAAMRQKWAETDRECYVSYMGRNVHGMLEECTTTFIAWSNDRAHYAKMAMKEMGITEEDQFYA